MSTKSDEKQDRSLLPMINKMSFDTLNKLPHSERLGLSLEDLVQEAKIVILTRAAKTYNSRRHVKFSTYAFKILDNYFKSRLRDAYTQKAAAVLYSLDYEYKVDGRTQTLYDRMARSRPHVIENKIIARIDAERGFIKAYTCASTTLRKYMIAWILQPKASNRVVVEGKDISVAMIEFKLRSIKFLTSEMCDTIQQDHVCRTAIANKVSTQFFTPRNDTCMDYINFTSRRSIEYALLPILSPERQASIVALVD